MQWKMENGDCPPADISLDAQREKIKAWANLNGYELAAVYVDEGISGGKIRPRAAGEDGRNAKRGPGDRFMLFHAATAFPHSPDQACREGLRRGGG